MRAVPSWFEYFFIQAEAAHVRSKDPTRPVGCVIVDPRTNIVKMPGFNGMAQGAKETPERWAKPEKFRRVCHAEANAICFAARHGIALEGCHVFTTCFPCLKCANLMVQAGIQAVHVKDGSKLPDSVRPDVQEVIDLFAECGVAFFPGEYKLAKNQDAGE